MKAKPTYVSEQEKEVSQINNEARNSHMNYGQYSEIKRRKEEEDSIEEQRKMARACGDTRYMTVRERMALKQQQEQ